MPTAPHIAAAEEAFKKTIDHLKVEFAKLQIGRASPILIEDILVEAYGTMQPLKAVASVSVPDPRSLQIQPWDKSIVAAIEKAIFAANLGLTPVNDGNYVRINFPLLTEERRQELVKIVHRMAEDARISIRHSRGEAHEGFKMLEKDHKISEDEARLAEKHLQERVDFYNKEIETLAKKKAEDITTI